MITIEVSFVPGWNSRKDDYVTLCDHATSFPTHHSLNIRDRLIPTTFVPVCFFFQKKKTNKQSNYIGVSWSADQKKWLAQRCVMGKQHFGGYFTNEGEAAVASDTLVLQNIQDTRGYELNFPNLRDLPLPRKVKIHFFSNFVISSTVIIIIEKYEYNICADC